MIFPVSLQKSSLQVYSVLVSKLERTPSNCWLHISWCLHAWILRFRSPLQPAYTTHQKSGTAFAATGKINDAMLTRNRMQPGADAKALTHRRAQAKHLSWTIPAHSQQAGRGIDHRSCVLKRLVLSLWHSNLDALSSQDGQQTSKALLL